MELLETGQCHWGENPHLAVEYYHHGPNHGLVELCHIVGGRGILTPKYLPYSVPDGPAIMQLSTECLGVVIILCKQPPKILEDLLPAPTHLHGHQRYCHLPLLFAFCPHHTLLRDEMAGVEGVDLHATVVCGDNERGSPIRTHTMVGQLYEPMVHLGRDYFSYVGCYEGLA